MIEITPLGFNFLAAELTITELLTVKIKHMTIAEEILRKHVKVDWIISGDSGKAIIAAMEEYRNYQSQPLKPKNEHWHPVQFGFRPLFFLLDLVRDEHGRLRSIAVERATEEQFEGISFKQDYRGWSLSPIKIGRGFISRSRFDFTEDFQEAEHHAALPIEKPL